MSGMTRNYQAEQKELRYQTERRKEGHNMKREDVTKIFEGATDEQINALLDVNSADIGKAKADYNEKLEEIKALNRTVSDRDNQLKTLKESAGDNEALKQQITQLQTENSTAKESFQKELDKLKFDSALELKLASSGAKNPKALSNAIELIRQLMSEYKIPIIKNEFNSAVGFCGIFKKVCIFLVVAVAHMIGQALEMPSVRSLACGYYIANEGISILENTAKAGLPIPDKLKQILEQLKNDSK